MTAAHPGVDVRLDGVATTVMDGACFPGSSGSAVLLHNGSAYSDKKGNTSVGTRTMFLGVLFAGPTMQTDGKIVIRTIPTADEPIAQIKVMLNLGYIVKAREIAALVSAALAKHNLTPLK